MLSESELKSIQAVYPELSFVHKDGRCLLLGQLKYCGVYDFIEDRFILKPDLAPELKDVISDSYKIEIELTKDYPKAFPLVREVGGRIQQIKEKYAIEDIRELHVNKTQKDAVCLCPKPQEYLRYPDGVKILDFLNSLVVPFFYGLSYYERNRQWPWQEYGHGDSGVLEFYIEQKDNSDQKIIEACIKSLQEKRTKEYLDSKGKIAGHWLCICGSSAKFRDCHAKALDGLRALKNNRKNEQEKKRQS